MTKFRSRTFFILISVVILSAVFFCWRFNRHNGNTIKIIELRDVAILKEERPPFSYVLQASDGLKIPLAGNFSPMEKIGAERMEFDVVTVSIEITKYDQRGYFNKMRSEKERIDRSLGRNTTMFQYLNGVPVSDFNWYVQISKIVAGSQVYELEEHWKGMISKDLSG